MRIRKCVACESLLQLLLLLLRAVVTGTQFHLPNYCFLVVSCSASLFLSLLPLSSSLPRCCKMSDYEKIRRMFICGMTAMTYYRVVLPEVHDLHQTAIHLDAIATLMLRRGDLIPPPRIKCVRKDFEFVDSLDSSSFNFR